MSTCAGFTTLVSQTRTRVALFKPYFKVSRGKHIKFIVPVFIEQLTIKQVVAARGIVPFYLDCGDVIVYRSGSDLDEKKDKHKQRTKEDVGCTVCIRSHRNLTESICPNTTFDILQYDTKVRKT